MSPHFTSELSALVLIDYQVGTMQLIKNQMPDTSLRNAIALGKAALAFDMPIVLTSSQEDHLQGPIAESLQHVLPKPVSYTHLDVYKRQGCIPLCEL